MKGILRGVLPSLQFSPGVKCIHGDLEGPRGRLYPTPWRIVYGNP
jgi:hypothetical protein